MTPRANRRALAAAVDIRDCALARLARVVRDFAPVVNGLRRTLLLRSGPAGIRSPHAAEIETTVAVHFPLFRRIPRTESCVPINRHPLARRDILGNERCDERRFMTPNICSNWPGTWTDDRRGGKECRRFIASPPSTKHFP